MLESIPVTLIVGTVLGFLTGLGVGGGSLLILWLTMALNMDAGTARGINLLFFIPAAIIACLFRKSQGRLPFPKIWPAIAAGCVAAAVCSFLSTVVDKPFLKKGFGILLLLAGTRELLYNSKK